MIPLTQTGAAGQAEPIVFWLNPAHIVWMTWRDDMQQTGLITTIDHNAVQPRFWVRETPEQINALIKTSGPRLEAFPA